LDRNGFPVQRTGNFSEELPTTVIYDPSAALVNGVRSQFPGNVIPGRRINPSVQAAMQALPAANLPGNLFINTQEVLRQNNDNSSGRVGYTISDSLRLFGRYSGAAEDASKATITSRAGLNNAVPCNAASPKILAPNKVNTFASALTV
jgi:hypothetical protein